MAGQNGKTADEHSDAAGRPAAKQRKQKRHQARAGRSKDREVRR